MFERLIRLIGEDTFKEIQKLNIFIIGIGGVGGYTLESLIRSGITKITICDGDIIEKTNLNRQIISSNNNIGNKKVIEARKRANQLNPDCQITTIEAKIEPSAIPELNLNQFDYVIDACDDINVKLSLIEYCFQNKTKIISCMGTANRLNPEKLQISTLLKTKNDPLAKKMRNLLRKKNNDYLNVPVVFSDELPIKNEKLGTFCSVPMVAGSLMASYVINNEIKRIQTKKSASL